MREAYARWDTLEEAASEELLNDNTALCITKGML